MPTAYVSKMADKHDISVDAAEHKWAKAKKLAAEKYKHGTRRYWPYVMGIFKRMLGEEGPVTFKDWVELDSELFEAGPSLPKQTKSWPGEDIIQPTSYTLHRMPAKALNKVIYEIRRLMDDPEDDALAEITVTKRGDRVLWQVHYDKNFDWNLRSKWVGINDPDVKDFKAFKAFVLDSLRNTGTINEGNLAP